MSAKCPTCSKTVYFAERVSAAGKDYHKLCFKCKTCKKALEPGKFNEKDNDLFCKTCYGSQFAPKGYGFGGSVETFRDDPAAKAADNAAKPGSKFCGNCGVNVAGSKFCSQCGTKVND